ncbi:hypothetical protein [Rufibacter latericius]|uniref:Uncharacterized protein n=1 Tax=Rufibacter latericius TaxID=2487040 RepID=A0A3M9MG62_9BACT|nr:hypothetical protein [Rufibacter latericius]RNI24147.1 hypothetical protein EFB08_17390 [Rufibacter latericius]
MLAMPTAAREDAQETGQRRRPLNGAGQYYVSRGEVRVEGFGSFYEAYRYALNRFCSEDFTVWEDTW